MISRSEKRGVLPRWQVLLLFFGSGLWVAISERRIWDSWTYARFSDLVYGTGWRPYVTRSFIPFLIRTFKSFIPHDLESRLVALLDRFPFLAAAHSSESFKLERSIFLVINITALTFAAYGIRRLMRISNLNDQWSVIATVITICSIPAYVTYITYIYDAAAIALFTWSLVFLASESWLAFLPTFALCMWNKETGILLIWIFLLVSWKRIVRRDWTVIAIFASQILIVCTILWLKSIAFSGNPGGTVEWHLNDRKIVLFVYSIQTYITVLALIFLLTYRFQSQHVLLRRAVTIVPILISMAFVFGMLDEYRAYYEALPIVATMISVSIWNIGRATGLIPATSLLSSSAGDKSTSLAKL